MIELNDQNFEKEVLTMEKKIKLSDKKIKYLLKISKRAKRLRLTIYRNASLVVTKPIGLNQNIIDKFMIMKKDWILSKLKYFNKYKENYLFKNNYKKYLEYKKEALEFTIERINYLNKKYNFKFNKIKIKNQKTRWGSCSRKGNLNFNYKIMFLPQQIADYIITHELCHLKELNYSKKFWNLVSKTIPNYQDIKKKNL